MQHSLAIHSAVQRREAIESTSTTATHSTKHPAHRGEAADATSASKSVATTEGLDASSTRASTAVSTSAIAASSSAASSRSSRAESAFSVAVSSAASFAVASSAAARGSSSAVAGGSPPTLSIGTLVGIIAGGAALGALIIAACVFVCMKKRRERRAEATWWGVDKKGKPLSMISGNAPTQRLRGESFSSNSHYAASRFFGSNYITTSPTKEKSSGGGWLGGGKARGKSLKRRQEDQLWDPPLQGEPPSRSPSENCAEWARQDKLMEKTLQQDQDRFHQRSGKGVEKEDLQVGGVIGLGPNGYERIGWEMTATSLKPRVVREREELLARKVSLKGVELRDEPSPVSRTGGMERSKEEELVAMAGALSNSGAVSTDKAREEKKDTIFGLTDVYEGGWNSKPLIKEVSLSQVITGGGKLLSPTASDISPFPPFDSQSSTSSPELSSPSYPPKPFLASYPSKPSGIAGSLSIKRKAPPAPLDLSGDAEGDKEAVRQVEETLERMGKSKGGASMVSGSGGGLKDDPLRKHSKLSPIFERPTPPESLAHQSLDHPLHSPSSSALAVTPQSTLGGPDASSSSLGRMKILNVSNTDLKTYGTVAAPTTTEVTRSTGRASANSYRVVVEGVTSPVPSPHKEQFDPRAMTRLNTSLSKEVKGKRHVSSYYGLSYARGSMVSVPPVPAVVSSAQGETPAVLRSESKQEQVEYIVDNAPKFSAPAASFTSPAVTIGAATTRHDSTSDFSDIGSALLGDLSSPTSSAREYNFAESSVCSANNSVGPATPVLAAGLVVNSGMASGKRDRVEVHGMEEHGFAPLSSMKLNPGHGDYQSATYSIYGMYADEERRGTFSDGGGGVGSGGG